MKIKPDPIQEGVHEAFSDWILNHEISFPILLEDVVRDVFEQWLETHSTEIIAAIAKQNAYLPSESACRLTSP